VGSGIFSILTEYEIMTLATYRYEIQNQFGATSNASTEQIAAIEADDLAFQDAMDLPDGVSFAKWETDGKPVTVFRTIEAAQ
jgi:hypothetical protein